MSRIRRQRRLLEVGLTANNKSAASDLRSRLAEIPAKGFARVENEIEAQFLVPVSSLSILLSDTRIANRSAIQNEANKRIKIKQFYISPEKRSSALELLLSALPDIKTLLNLEISTFRLRAQRQMSSFKTLYFAQLKTKRNSLTRKEISIPLSFKLFRQLLRFADEGYVAKNRYIKSAFFSNAGKKFRVEAHIDQITALGLGKNRLAAESLPDFLKRYVIVEIELPNEESYQILQNDCWGSFDFIERGFNLQDLRNLNGDKISFRSLSMGKVAEKDIREISETIEKFTCAVGR